jgi:hypothetical protein
VTERLNPISPQFIPVMWAILCAFGFGLGVQKLFEFTYLSAGWQGGILLIVMAVLAFLAIEGWWFASQREVYIRAESIQLKTWLQVLFGSDGVVISWNEIQSAGLVFDQGKKLELLTTGRRFTFWVAVWDRIVLTRLLEVLRTRDIPLHLEWGET